MALTVVTASTTFKLTTLARAKLELSLADYTTDDEEYLNAVISEASDVIAHETNRTFAYQKYTETLAGSNRNELLLRRFPVNHLYSVSHCGTTLSTSTYDISDSDCGVLYKHTLWLNQPSLLQNIEAFPIDSKQPYSITYTAGWYLPSTISSLSTRRTLPHDVESACIQLVSAAYNGRGRDPLVKSERTGDAQITLFDVPYGVKIITGLPPAVYRVIDKYKVSI